MKKIISTFIVLILLIFTLIGCHKSSGKETVNETKFNPDGSYNLDRNNVNLSSYNLPKDAENAVFDGYDDYAPVKVITLDEKYNAEFASEAKENEVKVRFIDTGDDYRNDSAQCSFTFSALPDYSKDKESSYSFNGSKVAFLMYSYDESIGPEIFKGRNVSDENDHAAVIDMIAQANYKSETIENVSIIDSRLVVCIDNENGIKDCFIINKDFYILHFIGEIKEVSDTFTATEISVNPIREVRFLHLAAMASRYIYTERQGGKDYFNIARYFTDLSPDGSFEGTVHEAAKKTKLVLTYNGKETVLEDENDIYNFVMIFCGTYTKRKSVTVLMRQRSIGDTGTDVLKVTLKRTGELQTGEKEIVSEIYVTKEGSVLSPVTNFSAINWGTFDSKVMKLCLYTYTNIIYQSMDTYSFEEAIKYIK